MILQDTVLDSMILWYNSRLSRSSIGGGGG